VCRRRKSANLLPLEAYAAQPDQLISYYFWAEDYSADGTIRRTNGDMFFVEGFGRSTRFFRQGPAAGQRGGTAGFATKPPETGCAPSSRPILKKEVIAATWKVIRRETAMPVSSQFVPDLRLIQQDAGLTWREGRRPAWPSSVDRPEIGRRI